VLSSGVVRQSEAKQAVDHRDDDSPREKSCEASENGTLHGIPLNIIIIV
jgi:hypothetical protein